MAVRHYAPHTVIRQVVHRHRRGWADPPDERPDPRNVGPIHERQQRAAEAVTGFGLDENHKTRRRDALLGPEALWQIYRLNGDVFASVNGIARRVSTQDRRVVPTVSPDDDEDLYKLAVEQAAWVADRLEAPNEDDDFTTFWEKVSRDSLIFWHGPYENVFGKALVSGTTQTERGRLKEFRPAYGPSVWATTEGRSSKITGWTHDPTCGSRKLKKGEAYEDLDREQIDRIVLAPNNRTPYGTPPIEVVIREVTTLIRFSERTMWDADRSEIPVGFLVLTGQTPKQAKQKTSQAEQLGGKGHKIQVLHTMGATSPAQWVRIQPDYQQVAFRDVTQDSRKVIWRVFGTTPIEMGDTENANRASSQVELEVGDSHMVEPMLEGIASLINRRQIPLLVRGDDRWGGQVLCKFEWDTDEGLTPGEDLDRARADDVRLKNGSRTLNETRDADGFGPLQGGEVARVDYQSAEKLSPVSDDDTDGDDDTNGGPSSSDGGPSTEDGGARQEPSQTSDSEPTG